MLYESIESFCKQFKQQADSGESAEEYFDEVMLIFPTNNLQNNKLILGFLTELLHEHPEYVGFIFNFLSEKNECLFNQEHFSNTFNNFILKAAWNISFEAKTHDDEIIRRQFSETLSLMAENLAVIIPLNPIECFNNAISDCSLILQNNELSNIFVLCFFHKITQSRPDLLQHITQSDDPIYSNIKLLLSNPSAATVKKPISTSRTSNTSRNPYGKFEKDSNTPPKRSTATFVQRTNTIKMS